MDFTALAFYGVICGLLSLAAPSLGAPGLRLAIGAGVGIVAAAVLPYLQHVIGY